MGRLVAALFWLIYFLSPIDLIPDFIPGIGRFDDLILLLLFIYMAMRKTPQQPQDSWESSGTGDQYRDHGSHEQDRTEQPRPEQPRDPYAILGVKSTATVDEIKRAYRTQAARYHPDKVTHLGEEFQELAKKKFQDLQWAYETVLRERKAC